MQCTRQVIQGLCQCRIDIHSMFRHCPFGCFFISLNIVSVAILENRKQIVCLQKQSKKPAADADSNFVKRRDRKEEMEIDEKSDQEMESDSSEDDEKKNAELLLKVDDLERKIAANTYDYNSYTEIISALKELADLEKLRNARNRMAVYFPLTSELWMDWLSDELKIATTLEEKKEVKELFERAVKDYLSVDIWLEFVQFSIGFYAEDKETGIAETRKAFELALASVGLHVAKGALLWETYLEYENMVLSLLQNTEGAAADAIEAQQIRIASLFRRQMSCPLLDMDETFERFNTWLVETTGSLDDFKIIDRKFVESTFKTARQKLSLVEKFEEKLLLEPDKYESYIDYLEHEKSKEGSPAAVLVLYERAIANLCLHENVWLEYIEYTENVLNDGERALDIVRRALRNCTWSCRLALIHLRLLEKLKKAHVSLTTAVEQALSTGLQQASDFRDVWMAFLEYARRRYDDSEEEDEKRLSDLRAAFEKASEYISRVEGADPECIILQFWARVEYKIGKDLEKARLLWNDILADPSRKTAATWLEYINLEMAYGGSKHLRKLFPRALQQVTDWPEIIYNSWLNYERDEGTLESYNNCVKKCEARIKEMSGRREQEQQHRYGAEQGRKHWEDSKKPKRGGLGFKAKENDNHSQQEGSNVRKRKFEEPLPVKGSPEKRQKVDNPEANSTKDIVDNLLKPKDFGAVVKHDSSKDNRTIFISNLDYSTTEEIIREIFEADGNITDLRLVKNFKGLSKGYCYVEFDKFESAVKGLKRDRQHIGGRPMFVSKCDPDKETRTAGLRFSTTMEKNKLFVKGLPLSTTLEDLRELFGKFGSLRDVRLVTYRNGHSKGLAYVDYEDEVSAAQAILKTDGTTIADKTISVAISNPPARQKPDASNPPVASLGGGPKAFGARGRSKTQISFVPRSLQLKTGIENMSINSPKPNAPQ